MNKNIHVVICFLISNGLIISKFIKLAFVSSHGRHPLLPHQSFSHFTGTLIFTDGTKQLDEEKIPGPNEKLETKEPDEDTIPGPNVTQVADDDRSLVYYDLETT